MKTATAKLTSAAPAPSALVTWMQRGLIVLVAIMPFHAFLSVWLGHLAGHETLWESWKEAVVVLVGLVAVVAVRREPERLRRLANWTIYTMAGFTAVAVLVTLFARTHGTAVVFGLKTDIEFLVAFALAVVAADKRLVDALVRTILISSAIVIAFGLLQVYLLPHDWLVRFGYGAATVQPYELVGSSLHSVRIISTLGGANQLGSFVLLPLCLVAWRFLVQPRWWQAAYGLAGLLVLWHSYSRAAILGLIAAMVVLALARLPRRWWLPLVAAVLIIGGGGLYVATHGVSHNSKLYYYLFHQTADATGSVGSTNQHALALRQGLKVVEQHPLGLGLGSAGPASFHSSHPLIPENYYLQLAIEAGLAGLALFVAAEAVLGWQLWRIRARSQAAPAVLAALVGIAVVNLFLHGWADSSTALVFWSLAGAVAGSAAMLPSTPQEART